MWKKSVVLLICIGVLFISSSASNTKLSSKESTQIQQIRKDYVQVSDSLVQSLQSLYRTLEQLNTSRMKVDEKHLLNSFLYTRRYYKQIEWLLSYIDPEEANSFNGSPFPKLDEHIPAVVSIEPQGLQAIERYISTLKDSNSMVLLPSVLVQSIRNAKDIHQFFENYNLTDRQIIEAVRLNIIRIMTLGITGFDSPYLGRSLDESLYSWQSAAKALALYKEFFFVSDSNATKNVFSLLTKGEKYLQNNKKFATFDRWTFITKIANPLYASLLDIHTASGLEFASEVSPRKRALNYQSRSIFQTNAFNALAFAKHPFESHTPEQIAVGKKLFFDPILSKNSTMSCATCHQPERGYTDGLQKSMGSKPNTFTERNSPTLLNAALSNKYFYDTRTDYLEEQVEHVINSENEFHTSYIEMTQKLSTSADYVHEFAKAFPHNQSINAVTISSALSAFVRSLVSLNSEVDKMLRGEKVPITKTKKRSIQRGFNLFMGKAACGTCHFAPTYSGIVPPFYTNTETEVLGVPKFPFSKVIDSDLGKAGVYKFRSALFYHSFKTSTVRNVSRTAPYMHNGSMKTLEDVMQFYNQGGGKGMGLNVPNQTLASDPLNLKKHEIKDIIIFMQSLTDEPTY